MCLPPLNPLKLGTDPSHRHKWCAKRGSNIDHPLCYKCSETASRQLHFSGKVGKKKGKDGKYVIIRWVGYYYSKQPFTETIEIWPRQISSERYIVKTNQPLMDHDRWKLSFTAPDHDSDFIKLQLTPACTSTCASLLHQSIHKHQIVIQTTSIEPYLNYWLAYKSLVHQTLPWMSHCHSSITSCNAETLTECPPNINPPTFSTNYQALAYAQWDDFSSNFHMIASKNDPSDSLIIRFFYMDFL